jgi:tripartite-type tricarboxylate transporter receptor subunit TctC
VRSILRILTAACMSLALGIGAASAEWKPTGPVKLIVGNVAGGGADFIARTFAEKASKAWGQPVVVDNRGGAGGRLGAQLTVQSKPDGHTMYFGQDAMTVWPALYTNMPFDVQKGLVPAAMLTKIPLIVVVHPSVPAKSLKELLAYAKANPNKLNYGSNGVGSSTHLSLAAMLKLAGAEMQHIPYPGTPQRLKAILQNETQVDLGALFLNLPPVQAGTLRALATTSSRRLPSLPDVPTVREEGIPEIEAESWNGIFLPAGTPPDIVDAVSRTFVAAAGDPEVKAIVEKQGQFTAGMDAKEFAAYFNKEFDTWAKMAQVMGVQKVDAQK